MESLIPLNQNVILFFLTVVLGIFHFLCLQGRIVKSCVKSLVCHPDGWLALFWADGNSIYSVLIS